MMASDYESLIDGVLEAHSKSRSGLWDCAKYTWQLYDKYGMYEQDFTRLLCQELAVQVDTVYHWRKAWELRRQVLAAHPEFVIDPLTITHFYMAADYVGRMGFDWVFEWLAVTRDNHWSSRRMASEMQTGADESGTRQWLITKLSLMADRLGKLYGLSEYNGFSEKERKRIKLAFRLLHGLANKE